jgi:transposase
MKAYSVDLRKRIVAFVTEGGTRAAACRRFKVSKWTVYRYLAADREGNLAPKRRLGRAKTFADDKLMREVKANPSATLKRHAKSLGAAHAAIWRRLRQMSITLKKNS